MCKKHSKAIASAMRKRAFKLEKKAELVDDPLIAEQMKQQASRQLAKSFRMYFTA